MASFPTSKKNLGKKTKNEEADTEHEKTENSLKKAREQTEFDKKRLETILETIPSAVVIIDAPSGKISYVNKRAMQLYGFDTLGLGVVENAAKVKAKRADGTDYPIEEMPESRSLKFGQEVRNEEMIIERPDGQALLISANTTPLSDMKGNITAVIVVFDDITERKKAEKDLFNLAKFPSENPFAVLRINRDGTVMYTNAESRRLPKPISVEVGDIVRPLWLKYVTEALSSNCRSDFEESAEGRWFEFKVAPILSEGYVNIYGSDITKRKEAEEAARKGEAAIVASKYARSLIEASLDPLVTINAEGKITDVNNATEEATGWSRGKLIGSDFSDYFTEPEKAKQGYQEVFVKGFVKDYPLAIRHISGKVTDVLYNATLYRNEGGQIQGVFAAARDITQRIAMENELRQTLEKLRQSNAELEQFAYVASHDLQEPLRMVASYVQLLQRRYQGKLDAEADEFIAYAVDGANRMRGLIDDLLTYSRVGRLGKPFEPTNLDSTLNIALKNLQASIAENKAIITHDKLPVLKADGGQIVQLFQNLIGNAIKFHGADPPCINVSARDKGGEIQFSVKDNGIGIDPQYFDRLFKIFQRLHTREEYPGTGIGLAVCKKIVERHGGRIWIESNLGKGSTIYFTLSKKKV